MRSADRCPLPIWRSFAASRRAAPIPFADGKSAGPAGRQPNCCASSPWRAIVTRLSRILTSSIGSTSPKKKDRRAGRNSARRCATRFAAASNRCALGGLICRKAERISGAEMDPAASACQLLPPTSFANVSRRPMVRLNTGDRASSPIAREIALPLELDRIGRVGFRDRRFNPCVGKHFQRLRVEIGRRELAASDLNPQSLEVLSDARIEPAIAETHSADTIQFERQGLIHKQSELDAQSSSIPDRTTPLRNTFDGTCQQEVTRALSGTHSRAADPFRLFGKSDHPVRTYSRAATNLNTHLLAEFLPARQSPFFGDVEPIEDVKILDNRVTIARHGKDAQQLAGCRPAAAADFPIGEWSRRPTAPEPQSFAISAADNDLPIASPKSLRSCLRSEPVTGSDPGGW